MYPAFADTFWNKLEVTFNLRDVSLGLWAGVAGVVDSTQSAGHGLGWPGLGHSLIWPLPLPLSPLCVLCLDASVPAVHRHSTH